MKINKFRQINQNLSRGEVFTHPKLVVKIISKIPESVYLNKDSMFLVPGCGMGVFIIELVRVLVETYGYTIEDAKSRVIGVDNRIKYINYLKRKGYRVYHLDFLKDELPMKDFDVILGNPPYQDSKNKNKAHPLWVKFIERSFQLLKKDGYLSFISPDSWRTKNSSALNYFNSNVVSYIDFDIEDYFRGVGSTFCYYIIKNKKSDINTKTIVKYKNNIKSINLHNIQVLPKLELYDFVKKLLDYNNKVDVVSIGAPFRSDSLSNVSKEKTNEFSHELYHINTENYYSKLKHPYQSNKKIILNKTGTWNPFYDDGKIGFTHINLAILVSSKKQGEIYESYLNSKIIKIFIHALNVFGARDKFTMESIPFPSILDNNCTDEDLYKEFNLTQEEIDYIENYVG